MKNVGKSIAGTVLAIGMVIAQPGMAVADTHFTGDVVDVITDKQTYYRSEPIRVMAKYTNVGDPQLLRPAGTGLNVSIAVYRVGRLPGERPRFSSALNLINLTLNPAMLVDAHSTYVVAEKTIPAYTLPAGLYEVIMVFSVQSATTPPQTILLAVPHTVIQVK